jgi:hypothetical protein
MVRSTTHSLNGFREIYIGNMVADLLYADLMAVSSEKWDERIMTFGNNGAGI